MINAGVVGYGYAGRAFHTYLISLAEGIDVPAQKTLLLGRVALERGEARKALDLFDWRFYLYVYIDQFLRERFHDRG